MKRTLATFSAVLVIAIIFMLCVGATDKPRDSYIKYVEFNVTENALRSAVKYDIDTKDEDIHLDYIEILAYLGAKYGGDFSKYKESDMHSLCKKLTDGENINDITKDMSYYSYYKEAYSAVLDGMVGGYKDEKGEGYGLCWFSPIAKGFPYSAYDDFGASRSFGYARPHLGHDLMSATGTPVIAVEGGVVECMGWNMYGGWRIGIRSHDSKRYWYYAHLRQNRPFAEKLKEGDTVKAGDVIGYVGRTGYSNTENTNGIEESHLHIGLELIFDESQKECDNEIWVNMYALTNVLESHKSETVRNNETKEFTRKNDFEVTEKE